MTHATITTPPSRPWALNAWWRDGVAWSCSALTIAAIVGLESLPAIEHAKPEQPAIEIQLADIKDLPPDPPPPPKAVPQPQTPPERTPVATPQPQALAPSPSPVAAQPVPAPAPAPVAPAAKTEAPRVEPPRPVSNASANHGYEARVRALIEGRKAYPTGRQAAIEKPRGTVHVCVNVSRSGASQGVSIKEGSGSALLDTAAKRLLQSIDYPPFGEAVFAGEDTHTICTELNYEPPTS
ncbi:TonB family protein [Paludibacterium paludis]|uniref:TonB C-terminal domain-containing protein n=1 Tax=Paludibacterium paludis TaxID=1225769 RepID=A0A918U8R0_9NEIS|nr:TonB family protein [Paludibacterium paludis]GGY11140.1 hypothetical protein GCM10011289_12530 [Paludibacterium paludis]